VEILVHTGDFAGALEIVREVLRFADVGRHLTAPWRVVIAGAPNVGKSSLVNALAGFQRSIVSPVPGTTRDVVSVQLAIDGWPVEVSDTAGLRDGGGSLEQFGIERARAATVEADLVIWLLDASASPVWPDVPLAPNCHLRVVVNKVDLPASWDLDIAAEAPRISASTGRGVAELLTAIGSWLVCDPPLIGAAVPFTDELASRLRDVACYLETAPEANIATVLKLLST
jgi:tRNA modification GTPase